MKTKSGNALLAVLLAIGIFGGLSIVGMAMGIITIPWLKLGSQVQMERQIIQKTFDADNALYNYHWFKEKAADISATENKIQNAQSDILDFEVSAGDRSKWTFEDKTEYARISAIKSGLKNYYETIVADYNARAKEVDRSIFKDELPLFFSLKAF